MADYMISVGLDASQVLAGLKQVDQAIKATESQVAGRRLAAVPPGVTNIASGAAFAGQTFKGLEVNELARKMATATALVQQTREVNMRQAGQSVPDVIKGRDAFMAQQRTAAMSQFGLTKSSPGFKDFQKSWDAAVQTTFADFGRVLNSPQVLNAFTGFADKKSGPIRGTLGLDESIVKYTAEVAAGKQQEAAATKATADLAATRAAIEKKTIAAAQRGLITLEEANTRLKAQGLAQLRRSPTGVVYQPRDFSQKFDDETGAFTGTRGERRVYGYEQDAAVAKEVATQTQLIQQETLAKRGKLIAETLIKKELDAQVALSRGLTNLMAAGATAAAQRAQATAASKLQTPAFIEAETERRRTTDRLRSVTDPRLGDKLQIQREKELSSEASREAKRRREEEAAWGKRDKARKDAIDAETKADVKAYRDAQKTRPTIGATGDVSDSQARRDLAADRSRRIQAEREARKEEKRRIQEDARARNQAVKDNRYSRPIGPPLPVSPTARPAEIATFRNRAGFVQATEALNAQQLAVERLILAEQLKQLKAEFAKTSGDQAQAALGGQIAAVEAQIAAASKRQRALLAKAGGVGGGAPPPRTPPTPVVPGGGNFHDRLRHGSGAGAFFGSGALSAIRYGLPSMLLYGGASGITNMIKEAEELQYNLSRLEGQFKSTFGASADFSHVRGQILGIAKDTGLAADEIANLQIQITGAFASQNIDGMSGQDLVGDQVESAAKLAQTIHIPLTEITDGLTAASLAFEASFSDIGDVALALEQESGVLAKETVSFIGDIAPVAQEAGYELEEFAAIAAVAQQRSGRSGTALAESFGRVIPALTEQKDKLLELAAAESALGTPEFIDAIRQSNVKEIFAGIGRAYADMSTESQQLVVQLLGGRREAQSIIPAITNQALVDRFTEVGEGAEGTLDARFAKIQETLQNAGQRLGEALRQFGVEVLELGLADTLELAIDLVKVLLQGLSPIARIATAINDAFGGWPAKLLLAVGAYKALRALMTIGGHTLGSQALRAGIERVSLGSANQGRFTPLGASQGGLVGRYGAARGAAGAAFNAPRGAFGAVGAGARAGSAGLGAAMAGFGPALAVTGLIGLYNWANSQADKERAGLEELKNEIAKDNEDFDLDIPYERERRVKQLRAQAEDARKAYGGWKAFWSNVFNIMSEDDLLTGTANAIETTEGFQEVQKPLTEDPKLRQNLFKQFQTRLGKNTGPLRDIMNDYNKFSDATLRLVEKDGESVLQAFDNSSGNVRTLDDNDTRYITELANRIGVDVPELDFGFVEAALQGDNGAAILDLANGVPEMIDKYGPEAVDQAQAYAEALAGLGKDHPMFKKKLREAVKEIQTPIEQNDLSLEELATGFELGMVSQKEYIERFTKLTEDRRKILATGSDTSAQDSQLLDVLKKEQEGYKRLAAYILNEQSKTREIYEALGTSDDDMSGIAGIQNVTNLNDPNFKDKDARFKAATELIQQRVAQELRLAEEADDLLRINQILNEGIDIPVLSKVEFYAQETEGSAKWREAAKAFTSARGSQAGTVMNSLGEDPTDLARQVYEEFFSLGQLSAETKTDIAAALSGALGILPGITTDVLRDAFNDSTDFLINLMTFAGMSQREILAAVNTQSSSYETTGPLGAHADKARRKDLVERIAGAGKNNPFGDPTKWEEMQAKAEAEETRNAYHDVARARFEFRKTAANRDQVAIAQITREAANYERLAANELDGPEKQAAIKKAEAQQIAADQQLISALKGVADAKRSYLMAVARSNGDFVGAANLQIAQARADYNDAKAAGDGAGMYAAMEGILAGQDQRRDEILADYMSGFSLMSAIADANGDVVGAARVAVAEAQAQLNGARGTREINEAKAAIVGAQNQLRQVENQRRQDYASLFIAQLEFNGDVLGAARVQMIAAQDAVRSARGEQEQIAAAQQMIAARQAEAQAREQHRTAAYGLLQRLYAQGDPVKQAQLDVKLAEEQLRAARGDVAKNEAQANLIDMQRQLTTVMNEARYSRYNLRQAELQAMEDDAGAAAVAAQLARAQLADAVAAGAGTSELNNLRAQVISADKAAADAVFQEKMDDYKWLLDMGQITQSQYINYLEGLKSTLMPGTKQFKELELTIKQLRDGISGDLQANLPTSLALPTLYEARRFGGTYEASQQAGTTIGYQDQRIQNVNVYVTNGMSQDEVVSVLTDALASDRSGMGVRHY